MNTAFSLEVEVSAAETMAFNRLKVTYYYPTIQIHGPTAYPQLYIGYEGLCTDPDQHGEQSNCIHVTSNIYIHLSLKEIQVCKPV